MIMTIVGPHKQDPEYMSSGSTPATTSATRYRSEVWLPSDIDTRMYLNLVALLKDHRVMYFSRCRATVYRDLVLHIAGAYAAKLPNAPESLADMLRVNTADVEAAIKEALGLGLLILDENNDLSSPMITEWYKDALAKCDKCTKAGSEGGKAPRKKKSSTRKRSATNRNARDNSA